MLVETLWSHFLGCIALLCGMSVKTEQQQTPREVIYVTASIIYVLHSSPDLNRQACHPPSQAGIGSAGLGVDSEYFHSAYWWASHFLQDHLGT